MTRSAAQMIREAPFDLYGVVGFTGPMWVRSWEVGDSGAADMIALTHGPPPYPSASVTDVSVRQKCASIDINDTLLEMLVLFAFSGAAGEFGSWRTEALERLAVSGWRDVSISVSGRSRSFALLELDAHWAALAVLAETWLYVASRAIAWPELQLDVVQNRQQYIEGSALQGYDLEHRLTSERT